jgi:hypothetical protein
MIDPLTGMGAYGDFNRGYMPNPFFTLSNQFLPRNFKEILRWADYIITQSPTAAEVIRKQATYPITDFLPDTDDEKLAARYKRIFETVQLKARLNDIGFQFHTRGNVFTSVYLPFIRMARCPQCGATSNLRTLRKLKFRNGEFQGTCPIRGCSYSGAWKAHDQYVRDESRINLVIWDPNFMTVNHNPVTGESEYYYQPPTSIKRKVLMGDPMFLSTLPMGMLEAIATKQAFKFAPNSLYHMMNLSIGRLEDGVCIPPIMAIYQLIFHQAMMRRANEAIAAEHMTPLRVFFPQPQSSNGDPVVSMSLAGFVDNMKDNLRKFKHDPNHQVVAPIPVGVNSIGGDGKNLLVAQELQLAEESILMSLGVSREMMSGTTNWTSSTIGLRMLKNSMENYVRQVNGLTGWFFEKITSFLGIERVPVNMTPFELTDDDFFKQLMPALLPHGILDDITVLEAVGLDFHEVQRRKVRAAEANAETNIRIQEVQLQAVYRASKKQHDELAKDEAFMAARTKAYQILQEIRALDPMQQQMALVQLQFEDGPVAALVEAIMATTTPNVQAVNEQNMSPEDQAGSGSGQAKA